MKLYCIADEDTVRGFRLAGISGQVAATPPQVLDAIEATLAQSEIGILILTEKVAACVRERVDEIRIAQTRPLIVEIPGPEGPLPGRKTLRECVQEAVGIRVG